jgi:lysophospholipase L1-like esterase
MSFSSRARAWVRILPLSVAALTVTAATAHATPEKVGPPNVIDALGDSITRAFNSQGPGCGVLADCPANSWATGTNAAINSYYSRVKVLNPAVQLARPVTSATAGGNDAVTGAKMAGLPGQATNAVNAPNKPDQVMILLGANDVCTSSEATMTSVDSFRQNFRNGLTILSQGLPDARIDVSSIPNIYNLWNVLKGNLAAQLTWTLGGICQSMLASPTSTTQANNDRRARVRQRNIDFNTVLGEVCAEFIHCHYDGGAAFNIAFTAGDVGTIDYFHPNSNGQAKAAASAWANGPNFADLTAPTTTIVRDHPASGVDDWYREDVSVSLTASDNTGVAGSEYYYKLDGAGDAPWTKYTGPFTISAEGQTTVTARSVDVNGNVEASKTDVIKIDKTAPAFTLSCPSSVLLNGAGSYSVADATDDRSGLASDPDGDYPFATDTAGTFPNSVTIADRAGNETTHSCDITVAYDYSGLEQPVNADGSSIFKRNSAVPLKFHLADATGVPEAGVVAKVSVAKVSDEVEGVYVEADAKGASSTGSVFSDDGDGSYHYNLDTGSLTTGTWSVKVTLGDGTSHVTRISLR